MKLYYFIHLTGRDPGNSGIQRVVRNLGAALQRCAGVELAPVRWCEEQHAVVHAEMPFLERIQLFSGPVFVADGNAGEPIHMDVLPDDDANGKAGEQSAWLLMPEVPHLGSHDSDYPSVHLSYVLGYLRRHGIRTAAVLHDIMPLSHFGRENDGDGETLKFIIYANALAMTDLVIPVSNASAVALQNWFVRTGVGLRSAPAIRSVLLPEEIVGVERDCFLEAAPARAPVAFAMWGSVHPHKNQARVLDAFNIACARRPDLDLRLHLFGKVMGELVPTIARAVRRSAGRLRLHGFVDDHAMLDIVAQCRATIFLSLAEGYGLPVAESLWVGKPCLTSNIAPMTEIAAAGGCFLADPNDREEIVAAIETLATSDDLIATLNQELAARPKATWAGYADRVLALMADLPEDKQEMLVVPVEIERAQIVAATRDIGPSDLSFHDIYRIGEFSIIKDGGILYNRDVHAFVSEHALFYGPYWDLPKGRYKLKLLAKLEGRIEIRMTAGHGGWEIGRWIPDGSVEILDFTLDKSISGFEIVISRLPDTRLFELRQMTLERLI